MGDKLQIVKRNNKNLTYFCDKKECMKILDKKKKRKNELINCKKSKFIIKVHWVMIIMKHTKPLICGHKKKSPFYIFYFTQNILIPTSKYPKTVRHLN